MSDYYEHFDDVHPLHDDQDEDDMDTNTMLVVGLHDHHHGAYTGGGSGTSCSGKKRQRKRQRQEVASYYGHCSSNSNSDNAPRSRSRSTSATQLHFLSVTGTKCVIHRNDHLAEQLDQGKHLINYFGDVTDNDYSDPSPSRQYDNDGLKEIYADVGYGDGDGDGDDDGDDWVDIVDPSREETTSNSNDDGEEYQGVIHAAKKTDEVQVRKPQLLLDRYDARTLLEDLSLHEMTTQQRPTNILHEMDDDDDDLDEEEKRIIAIERFGDIESKQDTNEIDTGVTIREYSKSKIDSLRGKIECKKVLGSCQQEDTEAEDQSNIIPATSEVFRLDGDDEARLPDGVLIPKSKREYDIIKITAEKSKESPQFEVLLKVKQANNSDFNFLHPGHDLHPFYQWVKGGKKKCPKAAGEGGDEHEHEHEHTTSPKQEGSIAGLLGMYGSSSSSSEEDEQEESPGNGNDENNLIQSSMVASIPSTSGETRDDAQKGNDAKSSISASTDGSYTLITEEKKKQRLKRAKMLRNYFSNK